MDAFDSLLIHLCDVYAPRGGNEDELGHEDPSLVLVDAAVPCRYSAMPGGYESKANKQIVKMVQKFFMRPRAITEKNWLKFAGEFYNITDVQKPSGGFHHYEVIAEQVIPPGVQEYTGS